MAKIITAKEFLEMDNTSAALVDFYADWCVPCQNLGPVLEEVSNEVDVPIYKINVEDPDNKSFAVKNRVMSIPTLIMFKDGKAQATSGPGSKEDIIKFINDNK